MTTPEDAGEKKAEMPSSSSVMVEIEVENSVTVGVHDDGVDSGNIISGTPERFMST